MNPLAAGIEGSLIREIAALRRPDSIDLGLGEPSLLPQMRFFEAATAWVGEHGCKYTVNAGDAALRETIAKHYAYPGMDTAANVCLTPGGSQEAVYVAIKTLLDPANDELLVVEPVFPTYPKIAQLEGVGCDLVSLAEADDFAFDADRVLAAVTPATRMIVIVSPCNPTGRVISRGEAEKLAAGLLARGGEPVYVLHDEIYRELTFVDDAGYLADVYPHTIVCNSLSKSNALTGMRFGWTIAAPHTAAALTKVQAWLTVTANTFAQRIAHEIFATPGALTEQIPWYAAPARRGRGGARRKRTAPRAGRGHVLRDRQVAGRTRRLAGRGQSAREERERGHDPGHGVRRGAGRLAAPELGGTGRARPRGPAPRPPLRERDAVA